MSNSNDLPTMEELAEAPIGSREYICYHILSTLGDYLRTFGISRESVLRSSSSTLIELSEQVLHFRKAMELVTNPKESLTVGYPPCHREGLGIFMG